VLQSIDFGDLLNQIKNISAEDISELFDSTTDVHSNLDAVRELRNAVSHHAFLINYKFNTCIVESIRSSSLEHNIKNLRQLLPREYRYGKKGNGGITAEIETCKYEKTNVDEKETRQLMKLDTRDIVKMK
jgi:hypothetical protein